MGYFIYYLDQTFKFNAKSINKFKQGILFSSWRGLKQRLEKEYLDYQADFEEYWRSQTADWDLFINLMIKDEDFNKIYKELAKKDILLANSFPATISVVRNGDYSSFSIIYEKIKSRASLSTLNKWVRWAEDCYLPLDFIRILRKQ